MQETDAIGGKDRVAQPGRKKMNVDRNRLKRDEKREGDGEEV